MVTAPFELERSTELCAGCKVLQEIGTVRLSVSLNCTVISMPLPTKRILRFPSAMDPSKPVTAGTLYSFMWRQRDLGVIPIVTNRDLRRT